jgi:NDP-sugar pyrophosphorylase family protein
VPVETAPDAVVLCGGRGTRLQSVLDDRPKPMAPVHDRPFLEWLLLHLAGEGVRRVILAIGHRGEQIREHFGAGRFGLEVICSAEEQPLGTGGALHRAAAFSSSSPLLALNGDSYCRFDLAQMMKLHTVRAAEATIWLAPVAARDRFGSVEVDEEGRVTAFGEKLHGGRGMANAGVYLLRPGVVAAIAEPSSLERDLLPGLVGHGLWAIPGTSPLVDIGTPESLLEAEGALAREFHRLGGPA